jgi:hypothetical protein
LNSTSWSVNNLLSCKVSISSVENSSGNSICLLNYDFRKTNYCSSTNDLSSTTLKVLTNLGSYTLKFYIVSHCPIVNILVIFLAPFIVD